MTRPAQPRTEPLATPARTHERTALNPAAPWPFQRIQPETHKDWLRTAPEAPL